MSTEITRDALKAKLDAGEPVVLVEALPEKYYRDAHLPGAVNVPLADFEAGAPASLPDHGVEIVVYCASDTCQNSRIAGERLRALGYARVREYAGGKKDWLDAGYPVERA